MTKFPRSLQPREVNASRELGRREGAGLAQTEKPVPGMMFARATRRQKSTEGSRSVLVLGPRRLPLATPLAEPRTKLGVRLAQPQPLHGQAGGSREALTSWTVAAAPPATWHREASCTMQ